MHISIFLGAQGKFRGILRPLFLRNFHKFLELTGGALFWQVEGVAVRRRLSRCAGAPVSAVGHVSYILSRANQPRFRKLHAQPLY